MNHSRFNRIMIMVVSISVEIDLLRYKIFYYNFFNEFSLKFKFNQYTKHTR